MKTLYDFIDSLCKEYKIDASHDLQHSIRCVEWVHRLADADPSITEDGRRIAVYAVALHDMCDAKYTDVRVASRRIHTWLCENDWPVDLANVIIHIITTMSYSKLRAAMVDGEIVYPDHGRWQAVYHIVRHADLLEAYRVDRCYHYQKHVRPDMSDDDCWQNVTDLFRRRVFNYVKDGWIFLDAALEHTDRLEAEARRRIAMRELE